MTRIISRRVLQILITSTEIYNLADTQATCFWPDRSLAQPNQGLWVPCKSGDSYCCGNGGVCLVTDYAMLHIMAW